MDILVSEVLGTKNLSLRSWADDLFRNLEIRNEKHVTLDFSDIGFMSRSFANQYAKNKKASKKEILEKNMSKELHKMLVIASKKPEKEEQIIKKPLILNQI